MNNTKVGFTLSEVLLVLSVIGVVAALTIPSLIQKVNDDQYKVAWKKNFTILSQASIQVLNNDAGGNMVTVAGNNHSGFYKKYLNIIQDCGFVVNGGNCFHPTKTLDNTTIANTWFDDGAFILNDGTMIAFEDPLSATASTPRLIWVDVNGIKPPNTLGKDVFGAKIYSDTIKPFGASGDGWENTCATSGYACSAEAIYK